jgi:Putative lactococcus lactis phage r1t holin
MSVLTSKLFLMDAGERAVKTVAQSMVAILSAGAVGVLDVDWLNLLSISGMAGLLSLLTSVASAGSGNSASLVVDNKAK